MFKNQYVRPPCCRAVTYDGRVACCPLVSDGEFADGTNRQTPDRTFYYTFRYGLSHRNNVRVKYTTVSVIRRYARNGAPFA